MRTDLERKHNADELKRYYDTHQQRKTVVNLCNGVAHWNACDFIDAGYQHYGDFGCECWKQDGKHWCVRCSEVERKKIIEKKRGIL